MPSPQEVLKDPDFQALPFEEKIKVFDRIDPDFTGLPTGEKRKVMVRLSHTPAVIPPEPERPGGYWEAVGNIAREGLHKMGPGASETEIGGTKVVAPNPLGGVVGLSQVLLSPV